MSTNTHVHNVAKVAVRTYSPILGTRYTEFIFIDASGHALLSVIAYSSEPLEIDGAEFANLLATAKEPA